MLLMHIHVFTYYYKKKTKTKNQKKYKTIKKPNTKCMNEYESCMNGVNVGVL